MNRRLLMALTTAAMLALLGYSQDKEAGPGKPRKNYVRTDSDTERYASYLATDNPAMRDLLSKLYRQKVHTMERTDGIPETHPHQALSNVLYKDPQYRKIAKLPYYQQLRLRAAHDRDFSAHAALFNRHLLGGWTPELDKAFGKSDFGTSQDLHNALGAYMFRLNSSALNDPQFYKEGYPLLQEQAKKLAGLYGLKPNALSPLWTKHPGRGGLSSAYTQYLKDPWQHWTLPEGTDATTWAPKRPELKR